METITAFQIEGPGFETVLSNAMLYHFGILNKWLRIGSPIQSDQLIQNLA